jgi:uncharacterized membrane protein (TIGR02234 family)
MTDEPSKTATTGRERIAVLGLGVLGAALALLAASQHWLSVAVHDPLVGTGKLHPSGRDVAALVPAAALVGLAGSVAAVTLRSIGRHVAGLLLVAAGGAVGAAAVAVLHDPRAAAVDVVRQATSRTGDVSASASATAWPWLAVVAAIPLALAGAVTIVRGRRWSGLSSRYDAPTDPSIPSPQSNSSDPAEPADPVAPVAPVARSAVEPEVDVWDAVSRGEDPTR